ncbi:50S ribosomal protein L2 [Parcubacteria bacterium DG_74_2]|nr:MAG: 50S ribosomal protein L2 [Parcubacteria bacterium DG_74_2]
MRKRAKKEDFSILTKKEPEKGLTSALKKRAGRSKKGRVTVRHKGGRAKRLYRIINFGQEKLAVSGKVQAIEYDPNRTCFIALIKYGDGDRGYILCPKDLKIGDEIVCAEKTEVKVGNRLKLKNIPIGTSVHNIELSPGGGGKIVRAAGTYAKVSGHEESYTILEMPSKEIRKVPNECFASVGQLSREWKKYIILGKAGRKRHLGIRPTVRGTAMAAVDHPHGGGKGKSPIGLKHPKTPWGKPARGGKTRKRKWTNRYIIKKKRKK